MGYYLVIVNIIGFIFMWLDKKYAIHRKRRISEKNLILVAILGGSLGSIIGMYSFRHKTKHKKFTLGLPLILVVQIILIFLVGKA
ncbi:DUF1294 domain-containing protein [Romboutsia sp.]|uniref:DUF1294 domain-containing protein n=1 Tax=Romboutsia sp. TaxID=1965302 RepID=UPI003F3D5643